MAYVDFYNPGMRVGENYTLLCSLNWPGDVESILPIVISIVDMTIFSVVHAPNSGLTDPCLKIRELWGCRDEPTGGGSPYAHNVTPIFDGTTATGFVHVALKFNDPMLVWVIYSGQFADSTAGDRMPVCGGRSYLPLGYMLPPADEDMMYDIGVEWDDDAETWHLNPTSFLTTITGIKKFEWKLLKRITRQQRYFEVMQ